MMRIIPNNNNEDVPNDNEGSLKKGPWTRDEDAILIDYVNHYGEGDWNSVQKNYGLLRCGKSCRLRWVNHLKPNLKKSAFSPEEERIIIKLHAKLGNKWAKMASQLRGRTDNEIKNFWNTRIKRCERESLPIYPPEVINEATLYHLQEEQYFEQPYNSPLSSSSSCYPKKFNNSNHNSALVNPPQNRPISLYGSSSQSSSNLFNNQGFVVANNSAETGSHGYQYYGGSYNYNNGFNASSMFPPLVPSSVSLSQTPSDSVTPASSYVSGFDGLMGASSMVNNEYYEVASFSPQGNRGLLDALVVERQSLSRNNKPMSEDSAVAAVAAAGKSSNKRKSIVLEENTKEGGTSVPVAVESALEKKNTGDSSNETPMSSSGKKEIAKDPLEEISVWDDNLFSVLNNILVEMPMPEWYCGGNQSESSVLETPQPNAPPPGPTTDQELGWTVGTSWNNMPSIG